MIFSVLAPKLAAKRPMPVLGWCGSFPNVVPWKSASSFIDCAYGGGSVSGRGRAWAGVRRARVRAAGRCGRATLPALREARDGLVADGGERERGRDLGGDLRRRRLARRGQLPLRHRSMVPESGGRGQPWSCRRDRRFPGASRPAAALRGRWRWSCAGVASSPVVDGDPLERRVDSLPGGVRIASGSCPDVVGGLLDRAGRWRRRTSRGARAAWSRRARGCGVLELRVAAVEEAAVVRDGEAVGAGAVAPGGDALEEHERVGRQLEAGEPHAADSTPGRAAVARGELRARTLL